MDQFRRRILTSHSPAQMSQEQRCFMSPICPYWLDSDHTSTMRAICFLTELVPKSTTAHSKEVWSANWITISLVIQPRWKLLTSHEWIVIGWACTLWIWYVTWVVRCVWRMQYIVGMVYPLETLEGIFVGTERSILRRVGRKIRRTLVIYPSDISHVWEG